MVVCHVSKHKIQVDELMIMIHCCLCVYPNRSLSTFDQGLVPSICLSKDPVVQNGSANGTQNQTVPHHRLRSSSKSTSNLESDMESSKSKIPLATRSTSDLGSEISASLKRDLGSEASITSSSSDQYYDDNGE